MIPQLDSSLFTWEAWRAGALVDLGLHARAVRGSRVARMVLRRHAIGWAEGASVPCRPKPETKAVMFEHRGDLFWTHLFDSEFVEVFS